ncbi:MAG: hypothetical protein H6737_01555 [Alphaproteobacteria bacterium]|nr:hypothetical protein [Alphaproteobacteria bacterium]
MIALLLGTALAGPWTKAQGDHYFKAGADWYHTTKYVLPDEDPALGSTGDFGTTGFFGHQYSLYGEVGLSDGHPIQIGARVPVALSYVDFEDENAIRKVTGTAFTARLGDLEVTPQIALSRKHPIAAALTVKIPLYGVDGICEESVYRDFCGRPGDAQTDFTGWLLAGGSLAKGKAWVEGQAGYRHRTELFNHWDTDRTLVDSVAFGGTLGGKAGPLIGMLRVDGNKNLVSDPYTAESIRVGPQAMLTVYEGLALEARAAWDVYARNTSLGFGAGVGVSWRTL